MKTKEQIEAYISDLKYEEIFFKREHFSTDTEWRKEACASLMDKVAEKIQALEWVLN